MTLQAAAVFSSNMVLQQGVPVPVWGTAAPGAVIFCRLDPAGVTATGKTDAGGNWRLTLPAMPAGGPHTLTLSAGQERVVFTDVWLGEVWLAGGQSNMELTLANSRDGQAALAACDDPRLHFYATPKVTTPQAADAAESQWLPVRPDTAADLSAVAYYAAAALAQALDVHVGILECFWGGTYAHCWMPRSLLSTFPEGRARIDWYDAQVGEKTEEQFETECKAYQAEVDAWNARIAARRAVDPEVSWTVLNTDCGLYPWPPPAGRTGYQRPGNLYESMLRRVCPYAVRGFWYYQGEQDETWPQDYQALLTRLVRRWRADWGVGNLPFLLVQLPMYATGEGVDAWPTLRAAQAAVADAEPGCGLVVLADCGEADNIHPVDKAVVGRRLALLALDIVYRQPVIGKSPRLIEATPGKNGQVLLRFVHTGGGMYLAGAGRGFELAGPDGVFVTAEARIIAPDMVLVQSPAVREPRAVRYAWYNFGPAELYGGSNLAAAPLSVRLPGSA